MAGRLNNNATHKRTRIETAQAELAGMQRDIDEIALRTRQAIRRTSIVQPVLSPALDRLAEIRNSLSIIKYELASYWSEEQSKRWTEEVQE